MLSLPSAAAVSPLALTDAAAAAHTLLLLDTKLQGAGKFLLAAGSDSASVAIDAAGLEAFLK